MNSKIVAFCAGLACLNFLPSLPAMSLLLQVLVGTALICFRFRSLAPLFLSIAGLSWGVFFSDQRLDHRLSPALEGVPLRVSGLVKSLPEISDDQVSFLFQLECFRPVASRPNDESSNTCIQGPKVIRLSWYQSAPLDIEVGDPWIMDVKLKRPHGFANAGGFDYEKWLFSQNIGASGYVINQGIHKRLPAGALEGFGPINSLFVRVDKWRQHIAQSMDASTVSPVAKVFLRALTIGDQRGIQSSHYEVLTQTGTIHLLAVSGLHVSLIAGFVYFISRLFLKWMPGLPQRSVAQKWAVVSSFIVGTFYCALAGFSLPTFRAWIILLCFSAYFLSEKPQNPWRSYFISLGLVCVLQPLAVLDASFWLSFMAVAVILVLLTARIHPKKIPDLQEVIPTTTKISTAYLHTAGRWLQSDWRMQWGLFMGLLPLLLMLYGQLSLISPFFNMIAVPFVSWVVVPPALVAVLMLPLWPLENNFMFVFAGKGVDLFWQTAQVLAAHPRLVMYLPGIDSTLATLCLSLACVLCLLPKNFPGRWLGFFLILPALSEALIDSGVSETLLNVQHEGAGRSWGDVDMTVMDVGQGLALVFATQHHLLVYDTGPPLGPEMDAGGVVLAPFLRQAGFNTIDKLVLSHNDDDHTGGANSLMRKFNVKELVAWPETVRGFPQNILSAMSGVQDCNAPQYWQWDGVHFLLFSWLSFGHEANSDNNSSCLLKVWTENFSILVPGDIEKTIEYRLVDDFRHWAQDEKYPFDLTADLLIAPHHGSATSSSQYFIDAVSPEQVIFSAAYRSRFHHPNAGVVKRYERNKVSHFTTSESGALFYRLRSKKSVAETQNDFLSPQAYRQTHPRFWQTTDL